MSTQRTLTTTYQVTGMTCGHCAAAVDREINTVPGVLHVTVDLPSRRATVTSDRPLDVEQIAAAVDEAGCQLAS